MTKISITMDVYDEIADPDHETGLTEEGYDILMEKLTPYGDDVDIQRFGA